MLITKQQIQDKLGEKKWFDDQKILAAKINYKGGIQIFDEVFIDKPSAKANNVIHLEKYPQGILFKMITGFGFKSFLFPVSTDEIHKVVFSETYGFGGELKFYLSTNSELEFHINKKDIGEVKDFFNDIELNYAGDLSREQIHSTDTKNILKNPQKNKAERLESDPTLTKYKMSRINIWLMIGILFVIVIWVNTDFFTAIITALVIGGIFMVYSFIQFIDRWMKN